MDAGRQAAQATRDAAFFRALMATALALGAVLLADEVKRLWRHRRKQKSHLG